MLDLFWHNLEDDEVKWFTMLDATAREVFDRTITAFINCSLSQSDVEKFNDAWAKLSDGTTFEASNLSVSYVGPEIPSEVIVENLLSEIKEQKAAVPGTDIAQWTVELERFIDRLKCAVFHTLWKLNRNCRGFLATLPSDIRARLEDQMWNILVDKLVGVE